MVSKDSSCKGYVLQRYFLKRICLWRQFLQGILRSVFWYGHIVACDIADLLKTVPEKDPVWKDSSWKGSILKRQFLKRIQSEKTVPEKDPFWQDSSWKGSSLKRQFLKRIKHEKTRLVFFLEQNMNIYHNGGAFSFWDLLIRAFKPLHYKLQDHYCFKLFLVYFACCEFQVLRLKKVKRSYECPKLFLKIWNSIAWGTPLWNPYFASFALQLSCKFMVHNASLNLQWFSHSPGLDIYRVLLK